MVSSGICKHLYLYARSRRTSGPPWRPGSGPCPPLRYAAARCFWPVPRGSRRPRLHASYAVPIRPSAMPFMPSTSAVWRCCSRDRRGLTPRQPSSTLGLASLSGRCCTRVRGTFGKPTSRWTLQLAAEVSFAQDLTPRLVSDETIRLALRRLGVSWKRAKHWITSPDPAYARKKKRRDRLIQRAMAQPTWALGFSDEVWWSRLAQPDQHGWTDADATHKLQELTPPTDDPDPKALACYGLLVRPGPRRTEQMWLRFVAGRPVSAVTIAFLAWCSAPSLQPKASPPCC